MKTKDIQDNRLSKTEQSAIWPFTYECVLNDITISVDNVLDKNNISFTIMLYKDKISFIIMIFNECHQQIT